MKKLLPLRTFLIIGIFYPAIAPLASAGMGQALYERWASSGTADSMLTESTVADYTEILTSTEWGVGDGDALSDYRGRITAWLIPPVTGEYIFWLVTDDNGRLWLSSDHDPNNAQLIARETNWAAEDDWGGEGNESQSRPITLEGGKPYWLRGGYQEGEGGDHIRIGWGSTDAGIEEHTIITGQYIADDPIILYYYAYNPSPADGAVDFPVEDVQLSWSAPVLVASAEYSVYFGTDSNDLPLLASGLSETTTGAGDLATETTYAWRVDVFDPNLGGNPTTKEGAVWSFTTAPDTPVIVSQPEGTAVFVGETAIFTIEGYSANSVPFTYAWFKEGAPGVILSDTDTLIITNAQEDHEGAYMCTLSNTYGDITSEAADLLIKRLVGHWPFDQNLTDIVSGNNGVSSKKLTYVEGIIDDGYAIEFGSPGGSGVEISTVPYTTASWTISFWEKASTEATGMADYETMVGSGTLGWEVLDIGRYQMGRYHFALDEWYVYTPISDVYPREEWNMLALTYNSTAKKGTLYLNGEFLLELGISFSGFDPVLFVGDIPDDYPYFGVIDDLKVYNYTLGPLEVAVLYTDISGGTACYQNLEADVSGPKGEPDCVVDIYDLVELAAGWLKCNWVPAENCL